MTDNLNILRIGIAPREEIVQRTLALASGRIEPDTHEPKIWFTSMEALSKVMNPKNMMLLEIIRHARPSSITELAAQSGRSKSNLSRTLQTMCKRGLVRLETREKGRVQPIVDWTRFAIEGELKIVAA